MKKLIVLALAAITVFALVCFAGAVEFTDSAQIDVKDTEAVEVLSEMGIIGGMGDGSFQPKGTLTRAQAAKIIAYINLGADKAEALSASTAAFTDVPTSHWACKYVNYCAEQGIVGGVGNGKFDPNGKLTGFAFGKMLLVVVGFDAESEGLVGASWDKNTNKLLKSEHINLGLTINSKEISRQDACALALNAIFYGEEDDPMDTKAYETFSVYRGLGGFDYDNNRWMQRLYTCDESDLLWEGTELLVNASPIYTHDTKKGAITNGDLYTLLGDREFDLDHVDGWRNGIKAAPKSNLADNLPVKGGTNKVICTGYGVEYILWYDAVEQHVYFHTDGWRTDRIAAVTEPVLASDGTVLEEGTVTIEKGDLTMPCNLFTQEDVGTWQLFRANGNTDKKGSGSWMFWTELVGAKRAKYAHGTLKEWADGKELIVNGVKYNLLYATMANQQSISPIPKVGIDAGEFNFGDDVTVILDENNIAYGVFKTPNT